jgi:hypothetical protein
MKLKIYIILFYFCFLRIAYTQTITLNPIKDTYVYEGSPEARFGVDTTLLVGQNLCQNDKNYKWFTFIKFNLSSISQGAKIISATLRLYCNKWHIKQDYNNVFINCGTVLSDWDENINFIEKPSYNDGTDDFAEVMNIGWYEWNDFKIKGIVQRWIENPFSNHGFILFEYENHDDYSMCALFNSNEHIANKPELSIIYMNEPDISVFPVVVNFGNVSLGTSVSKTFIVTNQGTVDLSVSFISIIGDKDFAIVNDVNSFILSPSSTRYIVVQFTPSSIGAKYAKLHIQSNDPDENPFEVTLSANGISAPVPDISVNPTFNNYGDVTTDTSISQTFTVINEGTSDLNVSFISIVGDDDFFITSGSDLFTLLPGDQYYIDVIFKPKSEGYKTSILQLICNDPDENPYDIMLFGNGISINEPEIVVNPLYIDFDNSLGFISSDTITVINEGTANLIVDSVVIFQKGYEYFSIISGAGPFILKPFEKQYIVVQYTHFSIENNSAMLNIFCNDPDENMIDVFLYCSEFTTQAVDIKVHPRFNNYDTVFVGSSSVQLFNVSNEGITELIVTNMGIIGEDAEEFSIVNEKVPFILTPTEIYDVIVSFNPISSGIKLGSLLFISNDPNNDVKVVPLIGIGINHPPYICNIYPPPGAKNIHKNTDLQFVIKDDENGVDLSTLDVIINRHTITSNSLDQTDNQLLIVPKDTNYLINYKPINDFNEGDSVLVTIKCQDKAIIPNMLDTTYSFCISNCQVNKLKKDTVDQRGKIVKDDITGIEITIPSGLLDDKTEILIGIVENPIPLPDSVNAIGVTCYFGPDGLQFRDSVIIQIPNSLVSFDFSEVIDQSDLLVYYYSTARDEWNILNVCHEANNNIYVKVKEFCYLRFGKVICEDASEILPNNTSKHFDLTQNYPNPFNNSTKIIFRVKRTHYVKLFIYDQLGRLVRKIVNEKKPPGEYVVLWDGKNETGKYVSNGIYYYRLNIGNDYYTKKAILNK